MLDRDNFIALIPKLGKDEERRKKFEVFFDETYHVYIESNPDITCETAYHICGGDDIPRDLVNNIHDMIFLDNMDPADIYDIINHNIEKYKTKDTLKPCPFCGAEPETSIVSSNKTVKLEVGCRYCKVYKTLFTSLKGQSFDSLIKDMNDVKAQWNKRKV